MNLKRFDGIGIIVLIILMMQGCSYKSSFPENWPKPVVSTDAYTDISGLYHNYADIGREELREISNPFFFSNLYSREKLFVDLRWDDPNRDRLFVTLSYAGSNDEGTTVLNKGKDFYCKDGALFVDYFYFLEMGVEGAIASGTRKYFMLEDGSLAVDNNHTVIGHSAIFSLSSI